MNQGYTSPVTQNEIDCQEDFFVADYNACLERGNEDKTPCLVTRGLPATVTKVCFVPAFPSCRYTCAVSPPPAAPLRGRLVHHTAKVHRPV